MMENEQSAMEKLGIDIIATYRKVNEQDEHRWDVEYTVRVREDTFGPMVRLVSMVDAVCKSKNPAVEEQFNQLLTMLALTKEN